LNGKKKGKIKVEENKMGEWKAKEQKER